MTDTVQRSVKLSVQVDSLLKEQAKENGLSVSTLLDKIATENFMPIHNERYVQCVVSLLENNGKNDTLKNTVIAMQPTDNPLSRLTSKRFLDALATEMLNATVNSTEDLRIALSYVLDIVDNSNISEQTKQEFDEVFDGNTPYSCYQIITLICDSDAWGCLYDRAATYTLISTLVKHADVSDVSLVNIIQTIAEIDKVEDCAAKWASVTR